MQNRKQFNTTPLALFVLGLSIGAQAIASNTLSDDLTQPNAGVVTASAENTQYGETAVKAFDDNQYSKWITFEPTG